MDRLEVIELLKHLPDELEAETRGLSDTALRYRQAEGEYSIIEIAGHLRDLTEVWHKRIYSVWSLTDPVFAGFDGEASVREHDYQHAQLAPLIESIREWRLKTVDVLTRAVDWTRLGQHRELGRRSLKQWAEFLLSHDEEHLETIRLLKEAQAARQPA